MLTLDTTCIPQRFILDLSDLTLDLEYQELASIKHINLQNYRKSKVSARLVNIIRFPKDDPSIELHVIKF